MAALEWRISASSPPKRQLPNSDVPDSVARPHVRDVVF